MSYTTWIDNERKTNLGHALIQSLLLDRYEWTCYRLVVSGSVSTIERSGDSKLLLITNCSHFLRVAYMAQVFFSIVVSWLVSCRSRILMINEPLYFCIGVILFPLKPMASTCTYYQIRSTRLLQII